MAVRVFRVAPTLISFAIAIVFTGLSVKKRKEPGLRLIFLGMVLLFLGMSSLQIGYRLMEAPVFLGPKMIVTPDWLFRLLFWLTGWLPIISGISLAIGWYQFFRAGRPSTSPADKCTNTILNR